MTHGFPWETLRDRVRGAAQRKKVMEGHQKLTLFEEGVIESYCNTLYGWGWPANISDLAKQYKHHERPYPLENLAILDSVRLFTYPTRSADYFDFRTAPHRDFV